MGTKISTLPKASAITGDEMLVHTQNGVSSLIKLSSLKSQLQGANGATGGYYMPSVSSSGTLSWSPSGTVGGSAPSSVSLKGAKGATGATGDRGATGAKGLTGATGDRGATGAKGETGYNAPYIGPRGSWNYGSFDSVKVAGNGTYIHIYGGWAHALFDPIKPGIGTVSAWKMSKSFSLQPLVNADANGTKMPTEPATGSRLTSINLACPVVLFGLCTSGNYRSYMVIAEDWWASIMCCKSWNSNSYFRFQGWLPIVNY